MVRTKQTARMSTGGKATVKHAKPSPPIKALKGKDLQRAKRTGREARLKRMEVRNKARESRARADMAIRREVARAIHVAAKAMTWSTKHADTDVVYQGGIVLNQSNLLFEHRAKADEAEGKIYAAMNAMEQTMEEYVEPDPEEASE